MHAELEAWKAAGQYFDYLGFQIFYRQDGLKLGTGPVLLLIHGYPFNSWDWSLIWPAITQRFTVIAPDMIGMGFSDKPRAYEYSVADHADMHEALLRHLGVEHAHILAHDLGDSVGQELLARMHFGEQSYGDWCIDSITWLNGGLFNEAYTPRAMQKLMSRTPMGDLMSPLQGSPLSRRLLEPTLAEMFGPHTKPDSELMAKFHQILEYNDGKRVLHKVGRFLDDRLSGARQSQLVGFLEQLLLENVGIPVAFFIEALRYVAQLLSQAFGRLGDGPVDLDVKMGERIAVVLLQTVVSLDEQAVIHIEELLEEFEEGVPLEEPDRGREGAVEPQIRYQGDRVLSHPVEFREPDVPLMRIVDGVLAEDDGEGPRHGGLLRELLFLGTELAGIHVRVGDALFHADAVGFFEGDVLKLQLKLVPQKNIDGTPYLFSVSKLES